MADEADNTRVDERGGGHPSKALAVGATLGRYVILATLGRGGMGVVYAAYDPDLDRKVALKLLRPDGAGTDASEGKTRLLREAQAMARLSHPNVIAVHDVGMVGDRVFVAMEFVEGTTLARRDEPAQSWQETIGEFVQAGQGLAAAHARGLVHRDFKPDNAMIGNDGRVRVMDFGLARTVEPKTLNGSEASHQSLDREVLGSGDAFATPLTQVGAVMGTPAYMAPEQHLGHHADARSDQFSFCVALYEALYGERPFAGETVAALAFNVTQGRVRDAQRNSSVPDWVRKVLLRGLSFDPEQRWPAVESLLEQLGNDPARRRRRTTIGLGLVAASLVGVGAYHLNRVRKHEACVSTGARIAEVWNDRTYSRIQEAFASTSIKAAADSAAHVRPWLDRFADRWADTATRACLDAKSRSMPSLVRASEQCLDDRRNALEALTSVLVQADADTALRAVSSAVNMPRIDVCDDDAQLQRLIAAPEDRQLREAVRGLRRRLAEVFALQQAGRYESGLTVAREVLAAAESFPYEPLAAEAALHLGRLQSANGDYVAAEDTLRATFFRAGQASYDTVAADALIRLVSVVGRDRARLDDALEWGRLAEMMLARLGDGMDLRRGRLLHAVGVSLAARSRHHEALARFEQSLAIRESVLGAAHPETSKSLNSIGNTHKALGSFADAKAYYLRAISVRERTLGLQHPDAALSMFNYANVLVATGAYREGLLYYPRVLAIWEPVMGSRHPRIAAVLHTIAVHYNDQHEYETALEYAERALAIRERVFGARHPAIAQSLEVLGVIHEGLGRTDVAIRALRQTATMRERLLGADNLQVGSALHNLALILHKSGSHAEAIEPFTRSLAIREPALGSHHLGIISAIRNLGTAELRVGNVGRSVALLERAAWLAETSDLTPIVAADADFALAEALQTGGQRRRAIDLASGSAEVHRAAGKAEAPHLAEIEAWLAEARAE